MHLPLKVMCSRLWLTPVAILMLSLAGFSSSASAAGRQRPEKIAYQLHMVFFSHEAGLSTVIDPQVFVSTPGAAAGVGPQGIYHVANFAPAPANDAPSTELFNANGQNMGVTLGAWEAARGRAMLRCRGGVETVKSQFRHLIPRGVYSLFVVHFTVMGPGRFTPLGAADGSANSFIANPAGHAHAKLAASACLTAKIEGIVLVWHSDRHTHGSSIGNPGVTSHNHLIFRVP